MATDQWFALFDSKIGRCGIAWGERGVVGVQLPEGSDVRARARLSRRFPGALEAKPPAGVKQVIEGIARLLSGEAIDLSRVELDMTAVAPFWRRIYEVARRIPPGATLSYGEIAMRAGARGAARAVGQAMANNPFPILVPCHRVLAAAGRIGGFSANGGVETKRRLLAIEAQR